MFVIINNFLIEAKPRYCEATNFTSIDLRVMNWLWLNQLEAKLEHWCSEHSNTTNAEIQAEARHLQDLIEIEVIELPDPIATEILKIHEENLPTWCKNIHALARNRIEARLRAGREMLQL